MAIAAWLSAGAAHAAEPYKLLVFTKGATVGATEGVAALQASAPVDATLEVTDDATRFTAAGLAPYKAVVFLNNTGDVLTDAQQAAFEAYFLGGGGFLGVGATVEAEPSWTFLTNLIGTRASGAATAAQQATIKVADRGHAASKDLPERWQRTDRWYNFAANVRGQSHVLATVDQTTYTGGTMNTLADHPIVWCKDYRGGRSFYTALGNTAESFAEPALRKHLGGAMLWTAGQADPVYSDCGATVIANYKQTKISAPPNLNEPIGFDQFPDGRIIQTARAGQVRLHDPAAGTSRVIATIPVYTNSEDGLYGPAVDNDFATNKWVYLFYAPQQVTIKRCDGTTATITTPTGSAPTTSTDPCVWQDQWAGYFQLSRFKFVDGANPTLDLASEQKIMQVANNRGACCHVAGDIDFDSRNNLWLVTGDDTPAGGGNSGGFGPFNDGVTTEAQTVRVNNATGGTFTLTFNGQTTAPIAYNATATAVRDALAALSTVGAGNVTATGGPVNTANVTVTFAGTLAETNVAQVSGSAAGLTGTGTPAVATATTTGGGVYQAPFVDARRSSQNTNDLRGKVLRIKVAEDGSYTIPAGNLYPIGTAKTRPEIYAMGFRNPFRIQVDEHDVAYVTDYSPDSATPTNFRGPAGTGRVEIVRKPSNYGWPLCYGPELPYYRWNFTTSAPLDTPAQQFECNNPERGPQNTSRWVRDGGPTVEPGLEYGPPVTQPDVWYSFNDNASPARGTPCLAYYNGSGLANCPQLFPELGTGGVGPHGAAKYNFDPANPNPRKFPAYYDDAVFFGEFTRDYLREFRIGSDNSVLKINQLLNCGAAPSTTQFECDNPMDMQFGADGAFYLLTYGDGFFAANSDAGLYKWEYIKGQQPPTAVLNADRTDGQAPLTVNFNSTGTFDPDLNDTLTFAWDFENDGTIDARTPTATHVYTQRGVHTARLTVTDGAGNTDTKTVLITVGNTSPTITIEIPSDGGFFEWGNHIPFRVVVTDPEDASIDCAKVKVSFVLLHDTHGHGEDERLGCSGYLNTLEEDASHGGYLAGGISVEYTDTGAAGGIPALTTIKQHVLQIKRQQVEYAQEQSGTTVTAAPASEPDPNGGQVRGSLDNGDWIAIPNRVDLAAMNKQVTFRFAGGSATNTAGNPRAAVEIRLGSPTGTLVQTAILRSTGTNSTTYTSQTFPLEYTGAQRLYFVFRTTTGTGAPTSAFGNLNWIEFSGRGNDLPTDTPPLTTHSITPSSLACEGTCTGITGASKITLAATDDVEVASTAYRVDGGEWRTYAAPFTLDLAYGVHTLDYRSTDVDGNVEDVRSVRVLFNPSVTGPVGGSVAATLSLTLGAPATFGVFTPGVEREYSASTTATVISTAGDATLTVADAGPNPGHLVNGTFALPRPLQGLGVVKAWTAPTSNEVVPVVFKQAIGANDALRTGAYGKTLTFTLSTTTP